ncbi:MAG: hypothetical protein HY943_20975 [Gammaproteobacteria bacterium]|nr:hypothetical protein [Gammaproteobacteria bacterium]
MNKFLTVLTLSLSLNSAYAAGFQPWGNRGNDAADAVQSKARVEAFYRAQLPVIVDTPDSNQLRATPVPWYLQGASS